MLRVNLNKLARTKQKNKKKSTNETKLKTNYKMNIEIIIINWLNIILVSRAFHPGRGRNSFWPPHLADCVRRIGRFFRVFVSDIRKGEIAAKFQSMKHALIEDTKGFMSPEKFRDVRETGP